MEQEEAQYELFARCASGFEAVLADELRSLHAKRVRPLKGGVAFFGAVEDVYRACLWLRTATRIQVVLGRVGAKDADELYEQTKAIAWENIMIQGASIAVRAHGENSNLRNSKYTALKVKDALCDRLRTVWGTRPNVEITQPDCAIDVSLHRDRATLYLNVSGPSLHKRGYREEGLQTEAPLKETLAAGMLLTAGWHNICQTAQGQPVGFIDPLCGSGTLLIEAALIAAHMAPGLLRTAWGFTHWTGHNAALWERICQDARAQSHQGNFSSMRFIGNDRDTRAIQLAQENAKRAGLDSAIEFYCEDAACLISKLQKNQSGKSATAVFPEKGLLATNPPYGQRLLSHEQLPEVYAALRSVITELPLTWQLAVITSDATVDTALGEVATHTITCFNGPIETQLRLYAGRENRSLVQLVSLAGHDRSVPVFEAQSEQFAARLRKVAKERAKWARKEGITCYRLYDADLPDYAVALDVYTQQDNSNSARMFARIAEYQAPAHVDTQRADRRFNDVLALVPAVLDIPANQVFYKIRKRAKGGGQYRDAQDKPYTLTVREANYLFEVDLNGHLDTGLFLDHRITRKLVEQHAAHTAFLNLFAYTGAASVYAAGGGAQTTTTVDLSNTYLDWAKRNMKANGFSGANHRFMRADVIDWLDQEARSNSAYDLVFCDPPTFSNSKATKGRTFDVQRDYLALLEKIEKVCAPQATIIFSCNLRSFKFDEQALAKKGFEAENITAQTIPHDFERNSKIHHCYLLRRLA